MKNEIIIVKSVVMETSVTGSELNINSNELVREMRNTLPALKAAAKTFCQIHDSKEKTIEYRLLIEENSSGHKQATHAAVHCPEDDFDTQSNAKARNAVERVQKAWNDVYRTVKAVNDKAKKQSGDQHSICVTSNGDENNANTVSVNNPDSELLFNNIRAYAKTKDVLIPNMDSSQFPVVMQKPLAPFIKEKTNTNVVGEIIGWNKEKTTLIILGSNSKKYSVQYSEKHETDIRACIYHDLNTQFWLDPIIQMVAGKTKVIGFNLINITDNQK